MAQAHKPLIDGPASPNFAPLAFQGNTTFARLARSGLSPAMAAAAAHAPAGNCVSWGIPFRVSSPLLVTDTAVTVPVKPFKAQWVLFLHVADLDDITSPDGAFLKPMRGHGLLGLHAADYVFIYADGTEARAAIRQRREVETFPGRWGEESLDAVNHHKPFAVGGRSQREDFGARQVRARGGAHGPWVSSVWAWQNPCPSKSISSFRFEPVEGAVVISGISAGSASSMPLRWQTRRKAVLTLPKGAAFDPALDEDGLLKQIRLDMGQVISATPRPLYPESDWPRTYNNRVPAVSDREILVEYAAHPDARFHLPGGRTVRVSDLEGRGAAASLRVVVTATERVTLRVVDKASGREVPVKLHVHGASGEYLAPVDRHRIPNAAWFEDYSVDFVTDERVHFCTYIPGKTVIDLPLGRVYVEVSKGLEIRPVRKVFTIRRGRRDITIELEKVLPWRERGWVTADTHVHFLSPQTAALEGAAEGVNVTNLLASQWGELMTNVGDFDGRTTIGSREAGGDGEYLVRVGTENRQRVLGHISLLGYNGDIIAPMTTGGPDESAIGDPVGCLLTEWARQCRKQGGLAIIPHFPWPRTESAATIVSGEADGVEINSRVSVYNGLHPYSLADWYRYLNNGYHVAAVGGTDKMSTAVSVGMVRTYALLDPRRAFTYDAWKDAIRAGNTFVTFGPLMEFSVDGKPAGARIKMSRTGGALDVAWEVASATIPMTRVDLMVNGEVRESRSVGKWSGAGAWRVRLDKSSWLALLVRGHQPGKPEGIMAHSSAVMVDVAGTALLAAADAVTILDQIEGALAFIDTIGTRADTARYKEMRLTLVSAHRALHNRMHALGHYHDHSPLDDHDEHHKKTRNSRRGR